MSQFVSMPQTHDFATAEADNQQEVLHFDTLSGRLSVQRDKAAQGLSLQMDLPASTSSTTVPPWLGKMKPGLEVVLGY